MWYRKMWLRGIIERTFSARKAGMFLWLALTWTIMTPPASGETSLPQEVLVDLVKPAVVRITTHIVGTARIPEIKVDIRRRLVAVIPDKYTDIPVDEYLIGSGFIIHPDGYIATNAHVVSQETVKQGLASENALAALYENALFLSDEEMQAFLQSETENSFSKQVLTYVIQHSVFELKSERTVPRPHSEKQEITDLIAEGFPATIVSMNDNFLEDERDVALLRIEAGNLPALALGTSASLVVGKKAFIFGFPATAELDKHSSVEATFTQGVVSAIKQSAERDFKLFQTDAKVSEGSSGGPLFDEAGSVTGMITFQTDELSRSQGDTFAFALPAELVEQAATEAGIPIAEGDYSRYFKQGLNDLSLKRCSKATEAFQTALEQSNPLFVNGQGLDAYLKQCDVLRAGGLSLDTTLDEWKNSVQALGSPFFYLSGVGLVLFVIFGGVLFLIIRRMRREETEIELLEARLQRDEERIRRYGELSQKKSSSLDTETGEKKHTTL